MDTDSFVLTLNTKDIIEGLKNLEDLFDFSDLVENHELFSNKNTKVIGVFKIETPKIIWIDEFICLRNKMYASKCGDDSKSKLKCISKSQSKNNKFEEYYNCLFGGNYKQECDNSIILSINHETYLQRIKNLHYFNLMIYDVLKKYWKWTMELILLNGCKKKKTWKD